MKIRQEDFERLEMACLDTLKENNLHPYQVQSNLHAWQVFHKAAHEYKLYKLYDYLNDSHVETALRKIFKGV